eukprot:2782429-Pleurochrysis_carterae.AAC.6
MPGRQQAVIIGLPSSSPTGQNLIVRVKRGHTRSRHALDLLRGSPKPCAQPLPWARSALSCWS